MGLGKRAIASCLAACALGLVTAASASAAVHWNVNGAALGTGASEALSTKVELTKAGTETAFVLTVPELYAFRCTGLSDKEGKITGPNAGKVSSLEFLGCSIVGLKGEETPCTVRSSDGTLGAIKSTPLNQELRQEGARVFDVFTVQSGTLFASFTYAPKPGKSCVLTGELFIKGSLPLEVPSATNAKSLEWTAVTEGGGAKLTFGPKTMSLLGKGDLTLASGKTWGVGL